MRALTLRYYWCLLRYLNCPGGHLSLPVPSQSESDVGLFPELPWPVVVVSSVNFGFFPSSVLTQMTLPLTLSNSPPEASHCSWLGEAANAAGAANVRAIKAAAINKLMRLITLYPFLTTSTPRFMSQAVSGRMGVCGGWASCVCLYLKLQTSVRPFALRFLLSYLRLRTSFPARFPVPKEKPAPLGLSTFVAGCTTGSVCPRCPYREQSS